MIFSICLGAWYPGNHSHCRLGASYPRALSWNIEGLLHHSWDHSLHIPCLWSFTFHSSTAYPLYQLRVSTPQEVLVIWYQSNTLRLVFTSISIILIYPSSTKKKKSFIHLCYTNLLDLLEVCVEVLFLHRARFEDKSFWRGGVWCDLGLIYKVQDMKNI